LRVNAPRTSEVTPRIRSWGRFGVYWGALFGFTLSAVLTAVRLATDILTIGVVRTLMVAVIECVVITGGFAALAAAVLGKSGTPSKPPLTAGREAAETGSAQLAARPDYAADSASNSLPQDLLIPEIDWSAPASLPNIQASLNTIDAWENGNTGP